MDPQKIFYTFVDSDGDFDVKAYSDGVEVGCADGLLDGNRLLLADVRVHPEIRGHGIGKALLARFIQEADAAGVCEIWGSVMEKDVTETSFLLRWYERLGFTSVTPDAECVKGAAHKIVREH